MQGTGDCDKLKGDTLYLSSYYRKKSDGTPDYKSVSIGLQPGAVQGPIGNAQGAMVEPTCDDKRYAYGSFESSEPDADNFCPIRKLSNARVCLPAAPAWMDMNMPPNAFPAQPDVDLTYEFTNLEVYMSPESSGRQFRAELTYTKRSTGDKIDCSAKYTVVANFPATSCGLDEMMKPKPKAEADQDCAKDPKLATDDVECDMTLNLCVLTGAVPSVR